MLGPGDPYAPMGQRGNVGDGFRAGFIVVDLGFEPHQGFGADGHMNRHGFGVLHTQGATPMTS